MYYKNMNSPCYTAPQNYHFSRMEFGSKNTCESEFGSNKCEKCHTKVVFSEFYPDCRYIKSLYINPWDEKCDQCYPNCPSVLHPVGTWEYLIDTGTLGVGGQLLGDVATYYETCILPQQAQAKLDSTIKKGLITIGKIATGMVCPECLAAYSFYDKAKSVSHIFTQILHLDDYILAEDWYHQGYALGKITKELEGLASSLLIEVDEIEQAREQLG